MPRRGPHPELQALGEHLELLSWQCLYICGHCPGGVPYSNPAVIGMLKENLHKKVNVALIPIEDSIPEDRQVHYDWIGGARAAYSLDLWELADQRIMTLGPLVPTSLCNSKDKLHFQTDSAEAAIGALTVRALSAMVSSKPEAFPVLLVCSWNVRLPNIHRDAGYERGVSCGNGRRPPGGRSARFALNVVPSLLLWRGSGGPAFSAGCDADLHARLQAGAVPDVSQVHAGRDSHLL